MWSVTWLRLSSSLEHRCHVGTLSCVNHRDRIVRDPQVCGGEPTIRSTRITLRTVLASLSDGDTIEDILRDYPTLTEDDVRAVITAPRP
jgi:uncharacterized protein (DUF433 family)